MGARATDRPERIGGRSQEKGEESYSENGDTLGRN